MTNESNQALLAIILRSETKAADLLQRFKFADLANAGRIELGLTEAAFNRLRVGIELGAVSRSSRPNTALRELRARAMRLNFANANSRGLLPTRNKRSFTLSPWTQKTSLSIVIR